MMIDPKLLEPDRVVEALEMWKKQTEDSAERVANLPVADSSYLFPYLGTGEHTIRETLKCLLRIEAIMMKPIGPWPHETKQ